MPKLTFNTIEVLALAIAAFRLAGNKIVRGDGKIPGNKDFVVNYIVNGVKFDGCDQEELRIEAEELKAALTQQVILNTLTSRNANPFLASVVTALALDNVKSRDIGLVIWAPKLLADQNKNEHDRMNLLGLGISSQHIGQIGNKIEIDFTLSSQKYLKNYNLFVHTGHDQHGNLVNFFNKSKIDSGKISGRVKAHKKDSYISDACVTVLNYVKARV